MKLFVELMLYNCSYVKADLALHSPQDKSMVRNGRIID